MLVPEGTVMRKFLVMLAFFTLLDVGGAVPQKKYVALTFDDGPTGKYTARLLDILEEKDVRATFFLCSYRIAQYPELVSRMAQQGNEIGLHGNNHEYFSDLPTQTLQSDLAQESLRIAEIAGTVSRLVRPPGGLLPENREALKDYAVILWSVDPKDWATDDRDLIVQRVIQNVTPGDIILMHDASTSSVEAAAELIDRLRAEGYTFLTVSELAAANGTALQSGEVYHSFG